LQLIALKSRHALPLAANQCGLITKTDAERLISYLGMSCSKEDRGAADDPDKEEVFTFNSILFTFDLKKVFAITTRGGYETRVNDIFF
jgi:hypothetical protein